MNLEGLWSLELGTNMGLSEAGIIIFRYGRIIGGDSFHVYSGQFTLIGQDQIKGNIEITNYKETLNRVFGSSKQFTINMSGPFHIVESSKNNKPQMVIDGYLNTNKDQIVRLICEKQLDVKW